MRPRQNGGHFPDKIPKRIFVKENCYISMKISLNFDSQSLDNIILALVQVIVWRRSGAKPSPEQMMA